MMKIIDYAIAWYTRGKELDSFKKRYEGFDLDTCVDDFLQKLFKSEDSALIESGIRIFGELEIAEEGLEGKLLKYAEDLKNDPEIYDDKSGKCEILESIIWVLGDIGTLYSLVFIKDFLFNDQRISESPLCFKHILSAAGYSYFHIHKREIVNFYKLKNQFRKEPVKTQHEIDSLKKMNHKYAEYQQFLLNTFNDYSGGELN